MNTKVPMVIVTGAIVAFTFSLVVSYIRTDQTNARMREYTHKVRDASNIAQLSKAMNMYVSSHGGGSFYPPSLAALHDAGIIKETKVFACPNTADTGLDRDGKISPSYESLMELAGGCIAKADITPETPLAWNKKHCFDAGRNVVFFDSHVEFFTEENFQKLYADKILPFVEAQKKKAAEEKLKAMEQPK